MINIAVLSLSLLLSFSARTPKVQPNPIDYESAAGIEVGESKNLEAWVWHERENGVLWTGVDVEAKFRTGGNENGAFFVHRQVSNILRGGITTKIYPTTLFYLTPSMRANLIFLDPIYLGTSLIWDKYDPATCLSIGYSTKFVKIESNIYEKGLESFTTKIRKDFKLTDKFSIVPTFKYTIDRNKNEFKQGKFVFKVKI